MSLISNIRFHHERPGNLENRRSTSPDQGSQIGSHRSGSPTQQSRTTSPNQDEDRSRRDTDQLRLHAVTSARRDRLSTTAEERLVDFAQVRHHPSSCTSYSYDAGQLPLQEKLIDLCSKVFHIEQQVDRFEESANESQPTSDLLSIPKSISVGLFIEIQSPSTHRYRQIDVRYKAALLMVSTAEDVQYHDGHNKPLTMIMVRVSPLCSDIPNPHDIQDSFKGRQDFDKSWLSGGKQTTLRIMVGKVCNDARYDMKTEVRRYCWQR